MTFEEEWKSAESMIRSFCRGEVADDLLAEEILQTTCYRAFRGYASFQRRSTFTTWAIAIAKHEILRELRRKRHFLPIEDVGDSLEGTSGPEDEPDHSLAARIHAALDAAELAGELSPQESRMLRERLRRPDATWQDIAAELGLTPTNCAVIHLRALQKFRVFLFRFHAGIIGGRSVLEHTFAAARTARPSLRLGTAEADAFRDCVLGGAAPRRGQVEFLRAACGKIALLLGLE